MPGVIQEYPLPLQDEGIKDPLVEVVKVQEDAAAQYRATHSGVLTDLYGSGRPQPISQDADILEHGPLLGTLGGIVVPTSRGFSHTKDGLRGIARIAVQHGCPMVCLQSHDAHAADCIEGLKDMLGDTLELLIVDMNEVHASWTPQLESADDELTKPHRASNLAWKRTLGQMLAVRLGWEFILFIDDDITPATDGSPTLSPKHLAAALRALQEDADLQIVGWPSVGFHDNSVVGHARRLIGLHQDVFISGSAMLLRVTERMGFFPFSMYNEDWLMMVGTVAGAPNPQRALARGGAVRQKPYDPFRVARAMSEEAGELLGEGLMNLLEDEGAKGLARRMDVAYWKRVMSERCTLLRSIIEARGGRVFTRAACEEARSEDAVVQCMNAAMWAQQELTAHALARYAAKWWRDQETWRCVLLALAKEASEYHIQVADVPRLLRQPRTQ
jgi:hypothetical protein